MALIWFQEIIGLTENSNHVRSKRLSFSEQNDRMDHNIFRREMGNFIFLDKRIDF